MSVRQKVAAGSPAAHARRDDPLTSHSAARSLSPRTMTQVQRFVGLLLTRYGPMTDEQLIEKYREAQARPATKIPEATDSSIRTRRSELVEAHFVFDCGKALSSSGRQATLWGTKRPKGGQ